MRFPTRLIHHNPALPRRLAAPALTAPCACTPPNPLSTSHLPRSDWVSCVRFSPVTSNPIIVSGGWDKLVKARSFSPSSRFSARAAVHRQLRSTHARSRHRPSSRLRRALTLNEPLPRPLSLLNCPFQVWNLTNCKLRTNLAGHTGYINTVTVSPDGSLCASGGKDGVTMLWDLSEGKRLYSLDANDIIHSLCFSPNRYWLCAATQSCVKIWDLESKSIVAELRPEFPMVGKKAQVPYCVSLNWSADGSVLYTGYTDGIIRVWAVSRTL